MSSELHVEPGHYYSPIPSPRDIETARRGADTAGATITGIDLREADQLRLVRDLATDYDNVVAALRGGRFDFDNTWFTYADAILLALMIRRRRPRRIIEVGCGYSSAVILDEREAGNHGELTVAFVEPDGERLRSIARPGDLDSRLLEMPAQDVSPEMFAELGPGDLLLIDSSHVMKAGSDVHFLLTEALPRLRPGVMVHVHDVFWPFEYPRDWLDRGVSFNEAYALRLILQDSSRWAIRLFTDFLIRHHDEVLRACIPLALERPFQTGGIWFERT